MAHTSNIKVLKLIKCKGKMLAYNPRNMDAEAGDYMYSSDRKQLWVLYAAKNQGAAGLLSTRELKSPHPLAKVVQRGGLWYWEFPVMMSTPRKESNLIDCSREDVGLPEIW